MYTVVICDKSIVDYQNEYQSFLRPLIIDNTDENEYVFLPWNTEGEELNSAVSALQKEIEFHNEWRCIIITDKESLGFDEVNCANPFNILGEDYVNHKNEFLFIDKRTRESRNDLIPASEILKEIVSFRERKEASFVKALNHPLIKLCNWIMGPNIIDYEKPKDVIDEKFNEVNAEYLAIITSDLEQKGIKEPEKIKAMLEKYAKNIDEKGLRVTEKIREQILSTELNRSRIIRDLLLQSTFGDTAKIDHTPKQLLLISERALVKREYTPDLSKEYFEADYSQFYEDNLYPDRTRFLLADVNYIDGKNRDEVDFFSMIVSLFVLANNEYPNDAVKPQRVYRLNTEFSYNGLKNICDSYVTKLKATQKYIDDKILKVREETKGSIDNIQAAELFEHGKYVPVKVNSAFDKNTLTCDFSDLRYAYDDLRGGNEANEKFYWLNQYTEIQKSFNRYLREPSRAIKLAVNSDLKKDRHEVNEKALLLDEFQRENIIYNLLDHEEEMVRNNLDDCFNISEYKKKMEEANQDIIDTTEKRMTKKKTLLSSLLIVTCFFICFMPLVFRAFMQGEGETSSIVLMVIFTMLFGLAIFLVIFYYKWKLKNKFIDFNKVKDACLEDIDDSLSAFSDYFSNAKTVASNFATLRYIEDQRTTEIAIYNKHKKDIDAQIEMVYHLFPNYASDKEKIKVPIDCPVYDQNDYTKKDTCTYELPVKEELANVEFMQKDNCILLPNFISRITVVREELYD